MSNGNWKTCPDFPSASEPLAGSELLFVWQGGAQRQAPASAVAQLSISPSLVSLTANYQISGVDVPGTQYDNYGAPGSVTVTLPSWVAGLSFSFAVVNAQTFGIQPDGGDALYYGIMGSTALLSSATPYSLVNVGTTNQPSVWIVRNSIGTWSF